MNGGALTLTGTNNYSGATTVNGGSLRVASTGSLTSGSAVAVNSGATLGGSGTIGGSVSVAGGGILAPSVGLSSTSATTSNFGNGLYASWNRLNPRLQPQQHVADGVGLSLLNDHIAVTGALSLAGGTLNINDYNGTLAAGTYDLINYTSGSLPSASGWTVNGPAGYGLTLSTTTNMNQFDLLVSVASSSFSWNSTSSGAYGTATNWTPNAPVGGPNGAGITATFGGSGATIGSITVPEGTVLGGLTFNNASSTAYTLSGGSLTLNNNGAGPSVTVSSGLTVSSGNYPVIMTPLELADVNGSTTTFNVASGSYIAVSGAISETASSGQKILLTGGGSLELDNGSNSYTGGTTVNSGTLIIDGSGSTLGSGPLAINGSSSVVNVNDPVTVGSLSGSGGGQLIVAGSTTLTVNQSTSGTFNGTLSLDGGLVLANASGNTLTINGAPTLGSSSSITVNSGTLALTNNTVNSANVSGSPTASVAIGATLQLAGSSNVLSSAVNITTHGSGLTTDGALSVVGASTQTVGVISGDPVLTSPVTTYAGNTTVGDGTNKANLTATQILQSTLTINAGSTVTIAPSGTGIPADAVATATVATSDVADGAVTTDGDSSSDPFTAIQAAIASGSISSAKGEQLENRIAAIERLAAADPGLDVSLLEDRVLAALPPSSVWSSNGTAPLLDSGSGLLAMDSSTIGSTSDSTLGGAAVFAPSAAFRSSPAAVPEPSTMLLAALGAVGLFFAGRRRAIRWSR